MAGWGENVGGDGVVVDDLSFREEGVTVKLAVEDGKCFLYTHNPGLGVACHGSMSCEHAMPALSFGIPHDIPAHFVSRNRAPRESTRRAPSLQFPKNQCNTYSNR